MKVGILLVLSCISLTAIGQEASEKKQKLDVNRDSLWRDHMPPYTQDGKFVIYQDSVKMPQNAYWDHPEPKDYFKIDVVKSKEDPNKATIYFETKNPRDAKSFNFLSLKDIERIYTGSKKNNTLLVFDNQVVVNYQEDAKIDSSFIRSVEVINSGEVTQLKDKLSEFRILNVKLNWKNQDGVPKHVATAGVPKFYFAPVEKKEIKLVLPSEKTKPEKLREFRFLTLKDIEKKYTGSESKSTLFFLDGELLTNNLNSYQIDSSYVYKVDVLPSTGIDYLKNNLPVFNIVRINLATPENLNPIIYIRGNETAMKE